MNLVSSIRSIILPASLLLMWGCSIKLGPDPVTFPAAERVPVVRIGEVTEKLTGTWASMPNAGFKNDVLSALQSPEAAPFFSGDPSSLIMNIELTTDHADDAPRLSSLGALSMVTLGVIPLRYYSEWNLHANVKLLDPQGETVSQYMVSDKGHYRILTFPPTMLWLFTAGIRGESDGQEIFNRASRSLVKRIAETIDRDYNTLVERKSFGAAAASGTHSTALSQPVIV